MARKQTPHRLIDEGYTGRIIARLFEVAIHRGLGNPKTRSRDLAELMSELFLKGMKIGRKLENNRITNAAAGLGYGDGYPVDSRTVVADLGTIIPTELPLYPFPIGDEFVGEFIGPHLPD